MGLGMVSHRCPFPVGDSSQLSNGIPNHHMEGDHRQSGVRPSQNADCLPVSFCLKMESPKGFWKVLQQKISAEKTDQNGQLLWGYHRGFFATTTAAPSCRWRALM